MKRKKLWVVLGIVLFSLLQTSCIPGLWQDILASYLYGGYTYNITDQANWYNSNSIYYDDFNVRSSNYYNGYVRTPLPIGFTPRSYRYGWSGNQCTLRFYDGYNYTGNSCQRRFQYQNGQFYWLR